MVIYGLYALPNQNRRVVYEKTGTFFTPGFFVFFPFGGTPADLKRASIVATNWLSHQPALKGQYPNVQLC